MRIDAILPAGTPAPSATADGRKLAEAASDFEALLIGQMLKSARSDSEGWFGTGEDQTTASLVEMAEEQIAKVLAQNGGFGLASTIEKLQPASSTVQMSGKLR